MRSSSQQRQMMDSINHLTAQVLAAEEAINMREEHIKKLQQDLREKDETMAVLQAQVRVCVCVCICWGKRDGADLFAFRICVCVMSNFSKIQYFG